VLESDNVVTVRDTDSVAGVASQLGALKRRSESERDPKIMVVGNGGIALDLVASLRGVDVCWVVRHESIGDAFFDAEVGVFLLEELMGMRERPMDKRHEDSRGESYGELHGESQTRVLAPKAASKRPVLDGASVGPSWATSLQREQSLQPEQYGQLQIETRCEVVGIEKSAGTAGHTVQLSNGAVVSDVDMIISAIGVDPMPNVAWLPSSITRATDGGIAVNKDMKTSRDGIYAAGDACTVVRRDEPGDGDETQHTTWFQMRLWSQARSMGIRAAHCMLGVQDHMASDLSFDLFTHVTTFLGKRVVLLGSFNGQGLEEGDDAASGIIFYSRIMGDIHGQRSFVRVALQGGRIKGAICIGDTDLSETLENLIMDGLDVSDYGPDILDPAMDLDDVFD
jgi:hypothetical protein